MIDKYSMGYVTNVTFNLKQYFVAFLTNKISRSSIRGSGDY